MHLPRMLPALALGSLLLIAGAAQAQQQTPPQTQPMAGEKPMSQMNPQEKRAAFEAKFKAADTDGDGKLTKAEAKAGMPELYKVFDKVDTKKRGYLTESQIEAAYGAVTRRRAATSDYNMR